MAAITMGPLGRLARSGVVTAMAVSVLVQPVAAQSAAPVEVPFWHLQVGPLEQALTTMVEEFEAAHPDIDIQLQQQGDQSTIHQKVLAAINAGNPPVMTEIFDPFKASEYIAAGAVTPAAAFLDGSEDLDSFYPAFLADATFNLDGEPTIVTWPFARSLEVQWFNPNILGELGITPPATQQEFRETAAAITEATGLPAFAWTPGFGVAQFYANLLGNGGRLTNDDETMVEFDSPEGVAALQLFVDMAQDDGSLQLTEAFDWQSQFANEQSALALGSTASAAFMVDAITGFDLSWAPFPAGPEGQGSVAFGTTAAIFDSATPEQKEAAWTFLEWFSEPENNAKWSALTRFGFVPLRPSSLESAVWQEAAASRPGAADAIRSAAENAVARPRTAEWTQVETFLSEALLAAVTGLTSAEDALAQAADRANALLAS